MRMCKKWDINKVKEFILNNSECKLLSDSYSYYEKLKFVCECGEEFETTFSRFKGNNKRQCNECGKKLLGNKLKLSFKDVKKFIEFESQSGCILITDKYNRVTDKLMLKCKCGELFNVRFKHFKYENIRNCRKCSNDNFRKIRRKSHDYFMKEVFDLVGNEYTVNTQYEQSVKKISITHNLCNYTYLVRPNDFLNGCRCPNCDKSKKITHDEFSKRVKDITDSEYEMLNRYVNANTKITLLHKKCGKEYSVLPSNFMGGKRCPYCSESKGEKKINTYFYKNSINFITQKDFEDLLSTRGYKLFFDLYLENLKLLIEYDGGQHFKEVEHFGGKDAFKYRMECDKIKNQYCVDNNMYLIRIPYWEINNIEYLLDNVLHHFNIKKLDDENTYNQEIVERYLVDSEWNHDTYISWKDKENRYWLNNK